MSLKNWIFGLCLLMLSTATFAQDAAAKAGEGLFKANCASCHKVNAKLIGPALAGVESKYEKEWLYSWIRNSQAMVKAGDPQAVSIFAEYNNSIMTAFPSLTDEHIDNILTYVQAVAADPNWGKDPGEATAASADQAGMDWTSPSFVFLAILTLLLLAIMFMLSKLTGSLNRMSREQRGEAVPESVPLFKNRKFMAAASLLLFALLGYSSFNQAAGLGRQQGYQPDQPIKFSHKLHAGTHKIECQYCHSGASKGKSAVIPSANVCMNCHMAIQEGPKYGATEISKIYAASGWDPAKGEYANEPKPIEWVRIHNLPDHVYFNHAQHVNAGGLECQQCHGPIEEMEVVEQHSLLSMGWCIDCHTETEVKFTTNDYYGVYEKLHKDLKEGNIKKITVEDIGGLECQKCHY